MFSFTMPRCIAVDRLIILQPQVSQLLARCLLLRRPSRGQQLQGLSGSQQVTHLRRAGLPLVQCISFPKRIDCSRSRSVNSWVVNENRTGCRTQGCSQPETQHGPQHPICFTNPKHCIEYVPGISDKLPEASVHTVHSLFGEAPASPIYDIGTLK